MITDKQIRNQIVRKIYRIPLDKLKELDEFLSKLEQDIKLSTKNISFAGAWENIDDVVFKDLTENLINKRKKNGSRIDE